MCVHVNRRWFIRHQKLDQRKKMIKLKGKKVVENIERKFTKPMKLDKKATKKQFDKASSTQCYVEQGHTFHVPMKINEFTY